MTKNVRFLSLAVALVIGFFYFAGAPKAIAASAIEPVPDYLNGPPPENFNRMNSAAKLNNPFSYKPVGSYFEYPNGTGRVRVLEMDYLHGLYIYSDSLFGYSDQGFAMNTFNNEFYAAPVITAINSLPTLKKVDKAPTTVGEFGFMTVSNGENYEKKQFFLYKDVLTVNGAAYAISSEQYEMLKTAMTPDTQKSKTVVPFWFLHMNPDRVVKVTSTDVDGQIKEMSKPNIHFISSILGNIKAETFSIYQPGSKDLSKMPFKAVYTFDNGITYNLYVSKTMEEMRGSIESVTLYVESNEMAYACEYKAYVGNYLQHMYDGLYGRINPPTGKPVIYLYPESATDVSVKLDFEGEVTYTFPEYQHGWNVKASPDGTLINKSDGSTHYYLFWEGIPDKTDWDFSEGFVVKGSEVTKFLMEKLPRLGLTPREYNDFITYWAPEMSENEYNLVTFSTTEYDEIAELNISPKPDSIIRVHMVWKAIDKPVEIKEQVLPEAPRREGFVAVEWGGTRA